MKDAPKTIYLQVCDMDDCDDRFDMHEGVTWCQDKINDSDIEYTRADIQQQRTWVGLTDEERRDIYKWGPSPSDAVHLTEAKLKEKNQQPAQQEQTSCYCPNCEALSKQLAAQPKEPLTSEQLNSLLDNLGLLSPYAVARAIEAAHGIKGEV